MFSFVFKCLKSKYPCCHLNTKRGVMGPGLTTNPILCSTAVTCFQFGQGTCQTNKSIKNFDEYSKLVQQLNRTNFQELKKKYWDSTKLATPSLLGNCLQFGQPVSE